MKRLIVLTAAATAAAVAGIARRFLSPAAKAPALFDNVQLFDADKGAFLAGRAVLARDGKIAAIGAAGTLTAPSGAQVIDGRGKTLVEVFGQSNLPQVVQDMIAKVNDSEGDEARVLRYHLERYGLAA